MSDEVQWNGPASVSTPESKTKCPVADSPLSPVLLAEDNPDDVLLIRQALHETRALNPLQVVGNGEQAIQYLAGEGEFADRSAFPFPVLFLLDLKMPVKDGLEVLRWLNQHPEVPRRLPVVVLSSTELPDETQLAYAMDIQACIVKPLAYADLRDRIRILKEYWLDYEAAI
jgi:CheY-like chemotaxis protein